MFPTNTELVNSFVVCGLLTRRGTSTLLCVFVTMVVKDYARYAAPLTELLKVGREAGQAGSKVRSQ